MAFNFHFHIFVKSFYFFSGGDLFAFEEFGCWREATARTGGEQHSDALTDGGRQRGLGEARELGRLL